MAGGAVIAPARRTKSARRGIDGFEAGLLLVMGLLSLWVVGSDLWQPIAHGLVWTHTDGYFIVDQLQYLAWIQSSAQHFLVSDQYVLRSTPADYFQPAIIISGLLVRLGVAAWLALMLWKPVAVVGLFLAVRAAAHHSFGRRLDRRVALTLGLLFGSLSAVYGSLGTVGDMMPFWQSWGYPFGLMALALVVFGLVGYARAHTQRRLVWWPGLLGALAGMLHPWQGELMILIVGGAELVCWRDTLRWWQAARSDHARPRTRARLLTDPRVTLPVATVVLVAVPLLYYLGLGHLDLVWKLASQQSNHDWSWSAIAIAVAPLAVFAALGYRGRPDDFFELLIRLWPAAALVIYLLSLTVLGATPLHAVEGIAIPLALLAVKGARRSGLQRIPHGQIVAWAAVLVGTVPAISYTIAQAHIYTNPTPGNANFVTRDESHALSYLAHDPTPGGVLTQFYLGESLPGLTGRQVNLGNCLWSEPHCYQRSDTADALFGGQLSPVAARVFVHDSGARFLLASCLPHADLRRSLGSLVVSFKRFGCADVYQLASPSRAGVPVSGAGTAGPRQHQTASS